MKKNLLFLVSLVALAFAYGFVFFKTPVEVNQGYVQKIMYVHVPFIMLAYLLFFVVFFCSAGVLWKKWEGFDRVAVAAAELGTLYTGVALITGAIWGKPTWNTYWTWDAKLTITLITFLIYMGYALYRSFTEYGEKQMTSSAVLGVIGFLSIPLNHLSVTWWRTLHQPSTFFSRKDSISPELRDPLYYCLAAVFLFTLWILIQRVRMEKEARLRQKQIQENLH